MARNHRRDYLTRKEKGGNWVLHFRVPESHRGEPPFGPSEFFSRSTKTKDYREASIIRDDFFEKHDLFQEEKRRKERAAEKLKTDHDAYWETYSEANTNPDQDALDQERDILLDILLDHVGLPDIHGNVSMSARTEEIVKKLEAKREAIAKVRTHWS